MYFFVHEDTEILWFREVIILYRMDHVGGVAQLGERLPCTQEVIGSIPFTSTTLRMITERLT